MRETRRLIAEVPGVPALEPIQQPMYDSEILPAAGIANLRFFSRPQGAVFGAATKTLLETNMMSSGTLPSPHRFYIWGVQVSVKNGILEDGSYYEMSVKDLKKVYDKAYFVLHIGTKDYLTLPLEKIPQGDGFHGFAGAAATAFSATNGMPLVDHFFDVRVRQGRKLKPILIPSLQGFWCDVIFPNIVTIDHAAIIKVYLVGTLKREVQ